MLLQGKYRLGERIGAGAMAAVFGGTHVVTERPIAVKRLLPDWVGDHKALARFEREARAAGRIRSEHVVEVLDFDRDEQGVPFLVLERLFGETLAERMRRRPPIGPVEAIDIAVQALSGVVDMHRVGVIHRDIKPSNVFLCGGAGALRVKLVDFGIAKLTDDVQPHLTNVDEMLGSFSFTAPEQLRSSVDAGPEADLWSIGVLLYRMLADEQPFTAGDPGSVIAAILEHPTPALVNVSPEVAARLQPIVERSLQKRPEDRYRTAAAMRADLQSVRGAVAALCPGAAPPDPGSSTQAEQTFGDSDAADDAPTPEPAVPRGSGGRSLPDEEGAAEAMDGSAIHSAPLPPSPSPATRAPSGLQRGALAGSLIVLGAILGWTTTGASAPARPSSGEAEPGTPTTVQVSTDPEGAEVVGPGASVPQRGTRGEALIEVGPGGGTIEVSAPGYQRRVVELPVRSPRLFVRLARAAEPAPSSDSPPPPPPDDLEIVTEPPRAGPRPATARPRPARSSEGSGREGASSARRGPEPPPPSTGAAPAPIRSAPY